MSRAGKKKELLIHHLNYAQMLGYSRFQIFNMTNRFPSINSNVLIMEKVGVQELKK
jgi:hypothetical protein